MIDSSGCTETGPAAKRAEAVITVVDLSMRSRLTLALGDVARPLHLDSVAGAISAVRERPVRAVLLGQPSLIPDSPGAVGKLASACAGSLIAVIDGWTPELSDTLLVLGRHGVRDAVDVSSRDGLSRLRSLLTRPEWEITNRIATALQPSLEGATDEMRFFVDYLVKMAPSVSSTKALAAGLGLHPSSLISRFFRARLPSPKTYLAAMRLLYAAAVLENPRVSLAQAARRLNYSSPQSFMRHVREQFGVAASEFRASYSFSDLAHHFGHRILSKYRNTIRWFRPFGTTIARREDQMVDV